VYSSVTAAFCQHKQRAFTTPYWGRSLASPGHRQAWVRAVAFPLFQLIASATHSCRGALTAPTRRPFHSWTLYLTLVMLLGSNLPNSLIIKNVFIQAYRTFILRHDSEIWQRYKGNIHYELWRLHMYHELECGSTILFTVNETKNDLHRQSHELILLICSSTIPVPSCLISFRESDFYFRLCVIPLIFHSSYVVVT
jgi:hypothetical protein